MTHIDNGFNSIQLEPNGCKFLPYSETIVLSNITFKNRNDVSDSEIFNYILDSYTHEYIHYVIWKLSNKNNIITALYDAIEQYFRLPQSKKAKDKIFKHNFRYHYQTIEEEGFESWAFYRYRITPKDIRELVGVI